MARLTAAAARRAAARVAEAIGEGRALPPFPQDCRPTTPAAGRRIGALALAELGLVPVGLRLAPDLAAGTEVAGPLVESRLLRSPATLPAPAMPTGRRVTLALLAQLGADLPPRATPYRAGDVLRRIASLHAALDLAETRFADGPPDLPSHLADLAGLGLVVFGPPARAGWQEAARRPLAATLRSDADEAWHGAVEAAAALVRAAEAARQAGGLPAGALLLVAGLSPPRSDAACEARIARVGSAACRSAPPP
jgi:2-keto-4-pentenoate hydratase